MEEEKEMSGAYMVLFTISQLGGFYAFFIVVLGFLFRPVYDKCFQHEAVNTLHLINKENFMRLEAEREEKSKAAAKTRRGTDNTLI